MNVRVQVLVLSVLFSGTTDIARGQEESAHEAEPEAKNELGVFTGVLSNLTANESGPSIGADFTRELTEVIGLLVLGEFAKAGEREALVAGGVVLRPGANIKVVIAPGVILTSEEDRRGSRAFQQLPQRHQRRLRLRDHGSLLSSRRESGARSRGAG